MFGEIGRELKLCHSSAPPGILDTFNPSVRNLQTMKANAPFPALQVRLHVKKATRDASTVPALILVAVAPSVTRTSVRITAVSSTAADKGGHSLRRCS